MNDKPATHESVELLYDRLQSVRHHLPLTSAVYDQQIAEDIAEVEISDAQWVRINSLFEDEAEGLFGALAETFADAVRTVLEEDENL